MKTVQRYGGNCRGISTLEFIVILPFLLGVMLIGVELSRALATYNMVVQATREGARTAVVTPSLGTTGGAACNSGSTNPAVARACGVMATVPSIDPAGTNVAVACSASPCAANAQVTVTVTTTFTSLFTDFFDAFISVPALSSIPLTHRTVMRYE